MKLDKNLVYKFINKPNMNFNHLILSMIYVPMLNANSFTLYSYLFSELHSTFIVYSERKITELLRILNLDMNDFDLARKDLESLNLIKTFFDKDSDIIYFEIFEPLDFETFISNKKILSILINLIGQREFDKLQLIFAHSKPLPKYENISENLDKFFDSKKIECDYSFDFDELYKKISLTTSIPVKFTDDSKKIIDKYYLSHKLSLSEIEKCIYDAVIKKDDYFLVCENLLDNVLSSLILNSKNLDIFNKAKINRNKNIFIEKASIADLHAIFNDYKKFSSEQYFSSITKCDITIEEKNIIDKLKTKFNLPDVLINIMIDHSLNKTHGRLNEIYLFKVAKSFNISSIYTVEEAYNYLMDNTAKKNTKKPITLAEQPRDNNEKSHSLKNDNNQFVDDEIVEIKW
ncbi:MAG: DnaD domain protein [Malacoplasma sp.]